VIPTLFCYVANPRVTSSSRDNSSSRRVQNSSHVTCSRRLFLFECCDVIQSKKIIEQTHLKFKLSSKKNKNREPDSHFDTSTTSTQPPLRPAPPPIPQRNRTWHRASTTNSRRTPPPLPKTSKPASSAPSTSSGEAFFTESNYLSHN